jgi:hypothetical protein
MTVRTDVTVDFTVNPRIITVSSPSVEITVQDLHDTLREIEDDVWNLKEPKLLDSAGKEVLGSGASVAITSTLQDAQLAFQARHIELESGTVTTGDTTGVTLTDTSATFVTNLVSRGDLVSNLTDGSVASVLSVTSETVLVVDGLIGGVDNQFDVADAYSIFDVIQCNVLGGNLVAVDDMDVEISPIFTTFGTQVVRAASNSATFLEDARIGVLNKLLRNKMITDPVAGTITIFDDDGTTVLFTASLFEDAAGTQGYRGKGAERRDRLTSWLLLLMGMD